MNNDTISNLEKNDFSKIYPKEIITIRVNTVYAVGQINDDEYTELIQLIEITYGEAA